MKLFTNMMRVLIIVLTMLVSTTVKTAAQDSIIVNKAGMYTIPSYGDEPIFVFKGTPISSGSIFEGRGNPKAHIVDDELLYNFTGGFVKIKTKDTVFVIDPDLSCFILTEWSDAWWDDTKGKYVRMRGEDKKEIEPTEFDFHFEASYLVIPIRTKIRVVKKNPKTTKQFEQTMEPFKSDDEE